MPPLSHHLNCSQLAAKLGRNRLFITAMKDAGYQMEFSGTRSTLEHAEQWLRDHPDFRAHVYFDRKRSNQQRSERKHPAARQRAAATE